MNLLFVISSLKHGGAEKQTVLDANLFSIKHNVVLVAFQGGELKELISERVKLILINKEGYLKTARKLREIITGEKADAVNASLFASMIISVLACRKIYVPVIWYFHSHEFDIKFKSKLAFRHFSKNNCLVKIFFVSEELKDFFNKKGFAFPENKTDVLYNNYTVETGNSIKQCNEKLIIGYIGRLAGLKRVEYMIELAYYLRKEKIFINKIEIVGDGEKKGDLEKLAIKTGVNEIVNFTGFRKDVENYYDKFDIFALPSREECLSISLLDACVKGIPSVAFDTGGNNEILIDGKTGFLVKSKEEFFEKIKELVNCKQKRIDMGIEARNYCLEKFSVEKRLNKLESLFNNLNCENE